CKGRPEEVDVRFTPESRQVRCTNPCPLWAKSGHSCRSHSLRLRFQSPVWCNPKFNDFWQATKVVRQILRIFSFDRHSWRARYVVADGAVTQSHNHSASGPHWIPKQTCAVHVSAEAVA